MMMVSDVDLCVSRVVGSCPSPSFFCLPLFISRDSDNDRERRYVCKRNRETVR